MSNEKHTEMAVSDDAYATLLAAQARIAAVPSSETLIESISDDHWVEDSDAEWMINAASGETCDSEELDASDEVTVIVA